MVGPSVNRFRRALRFNRQLCFDFIGGTVSAEIKENVLYFNLDRNGDYYVVSGN